uniref:ATP synthase complex subunit 8 n=1 Tax=Potamotyphlus kaupii TaxID=3372812 RepID=W5RHF1_9AMPH|nr:ATP synthase F0 subunit 8 [Potomotyphlus kaupii]AGZ19085.1 ATP synthase F0 subunit 8 [Potomotyphlus kaupii]
MPQLNPAPWFWTLIIIWSALLIMWTKLTNYETTNPINPNHHQIFPPNNPWAWPW